MPHEANKLEARLSVVVCTDGRPQALSNTLNCLRYLDGPDIEVCVVRGPTNDGVDEVLELWRDKIKLAHNPHRNLSMSRNIGIGMARGDIVAFIDDDGLPEAEWLQQILVAFSDPKVAGAGGFVMDHTGARLQYRYASANRLGEADWARDTPAADYNFPLSFNFPYVQGTNSAFRRTALVAVGGFDEEFEFYLDETDLCCRLIDAGYAIRQLPNAIVHHKFLPSSIRNAERVTRVLYPVLKNKLYFSIVNNKGHVSMAQVIENMQAFVRAQEGHLWHHAEAKRIPVSDLEVYSADVEQAWRDGLERGLLGRRRLASAAQLEIGGDDFRAFERPLGTAKRDRFVFLTPEFPPAKMGGIGRYIQQLARAIAKIGHHVHVVTREDGFDRVDFEDGVWVHRVIAKPANFAPHLPIPPHIWSNAFSLYLEAKTIAARHEITALYAPIWDCQGAAALFDGRFPLVTGLQTTLHFWLESHPHIAADAEFQNEFAQPMLALEAHILETSDAVHAISAAIARDIANAYDVPMAAPRTDIVPLGLDDWSQLPSDMPEDLPPGSLRLLFVGRLESRKGIDVLLGILPGLLSKYTHIHVDLVGNDSIAGPDGRTYRTAFQAENSAEILDRVRFCGEVSEAQLRGYYRACDIFIAPSRFESFGLILVEAMIFSKPIVASRAGGMVEVVEEGVTALLAEPGEPTSLQACIERVVGDVRLQAEMGEAGRRRYENRFSSSAMAQGVVGLMQRAHESHSNMDIRLDTALTVEPRCFS